MNVEITQGRNNPSFVIAQWADKVADTSTALGGWLNAAELVGKELGATKLDQIHFEISAAGELDFLDGLRSRIGLYRSPIPRGRS